MNILVVMCKTSPNFSQMAHYKLVVGAIKS